MTAWESFLGLAGTGMLALLALFMFVGGGFFLALVVIALLVASFGVLLWRALTAPAEAEPAAVESPQAAAPWPAPEGAYRWSTAARVAFSGVLVAGVAVAAVHAFLGLYHLTIIALLATAAGTAVLLGETVPAVARRIRSELALVNRVAAPGRPMALRVVQAGGRCAWGYHEVDHWAIDSHGRVSPRLCQAVATSLAPVLQSPTAGSGEECPLRCHCPLAGREVTFAMRAMSVAA